MQFPNQQNKKLVQLNNSNVLGDLYASFGIDLSENEGVTRLGKRLLIQTNTADVAEITSYPCAFKTFGTAKFMVAGASGTGYVFKSTSAYPSAGAFAKQTAANTPSNCDSTLSDMEISNYGGASALYVSTASNSVHWTLDGTTWGAAFTAGSADSNNPHMLTSYGRRMYMTRGGSSIISWDSANAVATLGNDYTLQLNNTEANTITFIRAAANRIWIGTINRSGGKGHIYEWDGRSTQTTKSYRLKSAGALACVIEDDVPYIIDVNGDEYVWTSGTFKKTTGLNRRRNRLLWNPLSANNQRFIHPNGGAILQGKRSWLIDGRNYDGSATVSSIEETIPSGIYESDGNKGLYHKYPFGLSRASGTIIDYGQARVAGVGALSEMNYPDTTAGRNGTFMAGATYYTSATASSSAAFFDDSNDTERKGGYLITTKLKPEASKLGPTITGVWKKVYLNYRKFLNSNDRIVVKYRATEQEPTQMDITWASTTSFTTTDANMANYAVGDEVEIVQGSGGGICSHITAISYSNPTYTVTVDETHPSASGTAKARLQKWVKMLEINDQTSTWAQAGLPSNQSFSWIQFKVWMVFTGQGEFEILTPVDTPQQIAQ